MQIDWTQIILQAFALVPILWEMKKNKADTDVKHAEQLQASGEIMARMTRMESKQGEMEASLTANNLQTCRIDLRQALQHSPDNIPAVLELARVYFINYHGNADLGRKFLAWFKKYEVQKWADAHGEDVSNLIDAATHSA